MPALVATTQPRRSLPAHALFATLLFLFGGVGAAIAAPTPSSGTLSNANPTIHYTGGLIFGANVDESTCNENVTCESFTLTLLFLCMYNLRTVTPPRVPGPRAGPDAEAARQV